MTWGPIDKRYLVAVQMRCEDCAEQYIIHTHSAIPGRKILSINERCECGGSYGTVIGVISATEEWPEFIDGF